MITWWAFALAFSATLFGAAGSLLMKIGSKKKISIKRPLQNHHLLLGLMFYGIGVLVHIGAYKGGELSIIYPISSLGYVWSLFLAHKYLKEKITFMKLAGISLIILGIIMLVI